MPDPFQGKGRRIGMRVTDDRYAGELEKFDLAMRMIHHEARTGTIRACTGFTEDRVRKLVASYGRQTGRPPLRRRRGKSPRQVAPFVSSAEKQAEATLLAALFIYCRAARVTMLRVHDVRAVRRVFRTLEALDGEPLP